MQNRSTLRMTAVVAACLAVFASAFAGASGSEGTGNPALSLDRRVGPPTSRLAVRLHGFQRGETVEVSFDGASVGKVVAGPDGTFAGGAGSVPRSARPGSHRVLAVGLASGAGASAHFVVQTDFAEWKFDDAKTGVNPFENVLNTSNVGQLHLLWRGHAYFGPEPPPFKNRRISSSPVISGGVLYIASYDGHLYAFPTDCATDCQPLWTADLATSAQGPATVAGGVVYVGSSEGEDGDVGHVYAFPTTCSTPCQPLWRADTHGPVDTSIIVYQDHVYVSDDSGVLNVYPTTCTTPCQPAWFGRGTINDEFDSSPTIADGRVFVGSSTGHYYAWDIATCSLTSGQCPRAWSVGVGTSVENRYIDVTAPASGGTLYFADFEPKVYAYRTTCQAPCAAKWTGPAPGAVRIESSAAVWNGLVYMGSFGGWEYIYPTTCTTPCSPVGKYSLQGNVSSSPTIANGVLYQGSLSHKIFAFDASCLNPCSPLWSFTTGGNVFSTAAVADGRVYVGSNDGYVYAFGLP
jgi:outer membrane protein assembly factor BamB